MTLDPLMTPVGPKAGKLGVSAVVFYGIAAILVCFVAAFLWSDGDPRLAAAIGVGSIVFPVTVGFFIAELWNQRAGALAFVMIAAVMAGALGAWAWGERDDYDNRRHLIAPGATIVTDSTATDTGT